MPKVHCDKRGVLAFSISILPPPAAGWAAKGRLRPQLRAFTSCCRISPYRTGRASSGQYNPQFQREYARIVEGLRKAGLPEGVAKSN